MPSLASLAASTHSHKPPLLSQPNWCQNSSPRLTHPPFNSLSSAPASPAHFLDRTASALHRCQTGHHSPYPLALHSLASLVASNTFALLSFGPLLSSSLGCAATRGPNAGPRQPGQVGFQDPPPSRTGTMARATPACPSALSRPWTVLLLRHGRVRVCVPAPSQPCVPGTTAYSPSKVNIRLTPQ